MQEKQSKESLSGDEGENGFDKKKEGQGHSFLPRT